MCTQARCTSTYSCTSMPVHCLRVRHRLRATASAPPRSSAPRCLQNAAPNTCRLVGSVGARTRIGWCPAQKPLPPLPSPCPHYLTAPLTPHTPHHVDLHVEGTGVLSRLHQQSCQCLVLVLARQHQGGRAPLHVCVRMHECVQVYLRGILTQT